MDIVEDLRKDPYEEERQYKREARLELGNMLDKAADEIKQLRKILEDVLETSGEQIPYGTVKAIRSALKVEE